MFKNHENAVSPVIGVILMVAITVILATIIAVFVYGTNTGNQKGPTASIRVTSNGDTATQDLKILHNGGERFKAGDWKISIVKVPDPPEFVTASSDLSVGEQIVTSNMTNSGTVTVTNRSITSTSPAPMESGQSYDVKIIVFPYKTMTVDTVITVR